MSQKSIRGFLLVLVSLLLTASSSISWTEDSDSSEFETYRILQGSTSFIPAQGIIPVTRPGHYLLQFRSIPSKELLSRLSASGVDVQRYVGGCAYVARISDAGAGAQLPDIAQIRSLVAITAEMRMHPDFRDSRHVQEVIRRGGTASVDIRFHKDVSFDQATILLHELDIPSRADRFLYGNRLLVEAPWAKIRKLLNCDEVDEIDPALSDIRLANLYAGRRMKIDSVLNNRRFHSPTGKGELIAITDAWVVEEDHPEFGDRITVFHDTDGIDTSDYDEADFGHATAVAGNAAAAGLLESRSRGPAPEARILSLVFYYDPNGEIAYCADQYGLKISSNSWSYGYDYKPLPPKRNTILTDIVPSALNTRLGFYVNFNYALDEMIRTSDVLSLWAAGNNGQHGILFPLPDDMGNMTVIDAWHRTNPCFDTLLVCPNSKNVLTIGATMKDDIVTGFSSRGPAYDGRIGPHLVAPGWQLMTLDRQGRYTLASGTSGSTPLVAGTAALLLQQYKSTFKAEPASTLLKAILIHSARDIGTKGPDYIYGYGMVDAEHAARLISGEERIHEYKKIVSRFVDGSIAHKELQRQDFTVRKGTKELRVTLAWNDAPGAKLINNLDLWVTSGNRKYKPLTLNANNPTAPAKQMSNKVDTAEFILIENPPAGVCSIYVKGTSIPSGPQEYSLVISAGHGNDPPEHLTTGDFTITNLFTSKGDINQPETIFDIGEDIYFHTLIQVTDNALYRDGHYGTVSARLELRDMGGELIAVLGTAWDNCAPTQAAEVRDVQFRVEDIPEQMPRGTFRLRSIVSMHNGLTKVAAQKPLITFR